MSGYYRIDFAIDLRDSGCLTRDDLNAPEIVLSNLEVKIESTTDIGDDDLLRNMKISHSPIVSYTRRDSNFEAVTYMTYIDYHSFGDLAGELLSEKDWTKAREQRIDLSFKDYNGPCADGYRSDACFNYLLGINPGDLRNYGFGALTNLRPEMSLSFYLPKITAIGEDQSSLEKQYQLLLDSLDSLKLHLYLKQEAL